MGFTVIGTKAKNAFMAAMEYRGEKIWGKKIKPVSVKRATKNIYDVKVKF